MSTTELPAIAAHGVSNRHSFFQIRHFVVGKQPTHQARLRQAAMEYQSRQGDIAQMRREIQDIDDQSSLLAHQKAQIPAVTISTGLTRIAPFDGAPNPQVTMIDRRIDALAEQRVAVETALKSKQEEADFLARLYDELVAKGGEAKPWDDASVQEEYWNAKFAEELGLRLMLGRGPDVELARSILSMPPGSARGELEGVVAAAKAFVSGRGQIALEQSPAATPATVSHVPLGGSVFADVVIEDDDGYDD